MAKISRSQQIFSEIDHLLDAGRYEDAKVLVSFLDRYWSDHESQLALLLINVTLYGPLPYKEEIGQLRSMADATGLEKEIINKIFLQAEKEDLRTQQTHASLSIPPAQPESAAHSLKDHLVDNSLLQERDAEIAALKKQLVEASEAKVQAARLLEETVKRDTQILRTKEAELDALEDRFGISICSLENELHEKERLLDSRDTELKTIQFELNRLAAQLADLGDAKDKESLLFREQLEQKEEFLRLRDAAARKMEEESLEQVRALETRLGKQKNLLATREAEIDQLMVKINELNQQRDALDTERESSEQSLQGYLEEESREQLYALEAQLSEQENLLATRDAAIDELRAKINELNQQRADLVAQREASERLVRDYLTETAAWSQTRELVSKPTDARRIPDHASVSDPANWLRRAWEQIARAFPENRLPIGAAALLIIAIGYYLASDKRTPPSYSDVFLSQPEISTPLAVEAPIETKNAIAQRNAPRERFERTVINRENPTGRMLPYMTRRIVSLRDEPRFGASVNSQIGAGIPINVLEAKGDWFKIRTAASGVTGYVRREHLVQSKNLTR